MAIAVRARADRSSPKAIWRSARAIRPTLRGGHLSESYMQGWALNLEAGAAGARRLRRPAGEGLRLRALHGGRAGRDLDRLRQGAVMRPLPQIDGADGPFWQALRRREVRVQRCGGCGTHRFPATRSLRAMPVRRERVGRGRAGGYARDLVRVPQAVFRRPAGALHGDPGAARLRRAGVLQSGRRRGGRAAHRHAGRGRVRGRDRRT